MKKILASVFALCLALSAWAQGSLEQNFQNPPSSAKPWTWWHWMNGNASKECITADLEAMAKAGVGGVQAFDISSCYIALLFADSRIACILQTFFQLLYKYVTAVIKANAIVKDVRVRLLSKVCNSCLR